MKERKGISLYRVLFSVAFGIILGGLISIASTFILLFSDSEAVLMICSFIAVAVVSILLTSREFITYVYKISAYLLSAALLSVLLFANYTEVYTRLFPDAEMNTGVGLGAILTVPFSIVNITVSMAASIIIMIVLKIKKRDRRNKK